MRIGSTSIATLTLILTALPPLHAQVGHDPASSPYRDLRVSHTFTFMGGQLNGGEGKARVGPTGGTMVGLRWDAHVGGAATVFLGATYTGAERNLVDPNESLATRYFAVASQDLFMFEGGFNFVLTGRKTWNRLAPYAGASMGMVTASAVPQDSSGFRFGNKFLIGPMVGVRIFPTRKFHLRLEAQDIIWRLSYNSTRFFDTPANAPNDPPVLDPLVNKNAEWVHHPIIRLGIGFTIR